MVTGGRPGVLVTTPGAHAPAPSFSRNCGIRTSSVPKLRDRRGILDSLPILGGVGGGNWRQASRACNHPLSLTRRPLLNQEGILELPSYFRLILTHIFGWTWGSAFSPNGACYPPPAGPGRRPGSDHLDFDAPALKGRNKATGFHPRCPLVARHPSLCPPYRAPGYTGRVLLTQAAGPKALTWAGSAGPEGTESH